MKQICQRQTKSILKVIGNHFSSQYTLNSQEKVYKVPNLATDAIVIRNTTIQSQNLKYPQEILLITRLRDPFKDCLAFPGGFVDYNEDPADACLRELHEECGISETIGKPKLVTVAGKPDRDPRKHIVSIVYEVEVKSDVQVTAGDDAATAKWYNLREVWMNTDNYYKLAFDHRDIINHFISNKYQW